MFNKQQKWLLDNTVISKQQNNYIQATQLTKFHTEESLKNIGARQQQQNHTTSVIYKKTSEVFVRNIRR